SGSARIVTSGAGSMRTARRVSTPATRRTSAETATLSTRGAGSFASRAYAVVNRLSESERAAITARPLRMSSFQSPGSSSRERIDSRLPAIDLSGASELLISWPITRMRRCQAWQRLIRVIGHEINNSLAPIKSIAVSLESILSREELPGDWNDDMRKGLAVIAARSDSLSRFTTAYARLAKLPAPRVESVAVSALVRRVAGVETRLAVRIDPAPDVTIRADPDQLEQLLINVLHNAVDAALDTGGSVTVGWKRDPRSFELWI